MNRLALLCLLSTIISWTGSAQADTEIRWQDKASGAYFLILPGKMNWDEADKACSNRGWDVFNIEYLSTEEQDRFLASEELKALDWEHKFVGEPGESESVEVWGSSGSYGSKSAAGIYRYANEAKRRRRYFWRDASDRLQTICMYLSHSWQTCHVPVTCHYGNSASTYFIFDSGRSKQEATQRLQNQVAKIPPGYAQCGTNLDEVSCDVVRPR